ncbi:MAG: spore germination protein GerW family protein [candidate division Zixibacteria bacterium]|nr:spore germination protein GerW family protein [candidate division Zixibacteria bacterium]
MPNNVSEILQNIVGELRQMARSQSVVGEPITLGNKIIVPLVKISVGFGAGGAQSEKQPEGTNFGGGGGGGAKIEPAAFIIIDGDKVSLMAAKPGKYDSLIEAVPALVGKLIDMRSSAKEKKEEESTGENK